MMPASAATAIGRAELLDARFVDGAVKVVSCEEVPIYWLFQRAYRSPQTLSRS